MGNSEGFLPFVILVIGNIVGQSDLCTVGQIKGRCDCNKYEVCLSEGWQEQTVPDNGKFATICSNCTAADTRNGCSNSQREVICTRSISSATTSSPLDSHLSTDSTSLEITSTDSTLSTPVSTDSTLSTPVSTDSTKSTPVSTDSTTLTREPTDFSTSTSAISDSTTSMSVSSDATETATATPEEDEMCPCDCEFADQIAFWENAGTQPEIEEEILVSKIKEIKKALQVNTSELTSTKIKKISAPDSRTSASVTGYVGLVFIVVVLGSIVILDFPTLVIQFRGIWRRIKQC